MEQNDRGEGRGRRKGHEGQAGEEREGREGWTWNYARNGRGMVIME